MIHYKYQITQEFGIHARPAVLLAKHANNFVCAIQIGKEGCMADAKDVMDIMSLMMMQGEELHVTFDGEDEAVASASMINLIKEHL